jgi:hypothetical protein
MQGRLDLTCAATMRWSPAWLLGLRWTELDLAFNCCGIGYCNGPSMAASASAVAHMHAVYSLKAHGPWHKPRTRLTALRAHMLVFARAEHTAILNSHIRDGDWKLALDVERRVFLLARAESDTPLLSARVSIGGVLVPTVRRVHPIRVGH